MKKLYTTLAAVLAATTLTLAQNFSVSGPKIVWNVNGFHPTATVTSEISGNNSLAGANFTLFNFETGQTVAGSSFASADWHMGFFTNSTGQVLRTILNGGGSGIGNVSGYVTNGTSFENYTSVPENAVFTVDGVASNGADKVTGWTNGLTRLSQYNAMSTISGIVPGSVFGAHTVTPITNRLLILNLGNGKYVKFELLSAYKGAPTSLNYSFSTQDDLAANGNDYGYVSFRYLVSDNTDLSQNITKVSNLDAGVSPDAAGNPTHNQFFSLGGSLVALTDSNSTNWDMAFKSTTISLNGGTSGIGTTSGVVIAGGFNNALDAATVSGFATDGASKAILTGSDNGWYHYDFNSHSITAIDGNVILVQTSNGRYAKLAIENYYQNAPSIACGPSRFYTFSYYINPYGTTSLAPANGTIAGTTVANPALAYSSLVTTVSSVASVQTLTVTSNIDWVIATSADWVSLSAGAGSGNGTLSISFTGSSLSETRTATISLSGCNFAYPFTITQEKAVSTGVEESTLAQSINVYPTPSTDGEVNIESPQSGSLTIVSVDGKASYSAILTANVKSSLQLPTGFYVAKIVVGDKVASKKIVVTK